MEKVNKIVVDDWEQIKNGGAQTLAMMFEQQWFTPDQIHAELGTIVAREKKGREDDRELKYFNSVGLALHDLVVANRLYKYAKKEGIVLEFMGGADFCEEHFTANKI